ncbi:hypothetical protein O4H66_13515 [Comamonadaceae bacterium G21597-S1]|nr:hypothetical protein [Comamonadaceae bacterium G21597-S1]
MQLSIPAVRLATALLLGAIVSGAGAQTQEGPMAPVIGDKWTYQFHNKGDKREPYQYSHQVKAVDGPSAWILGESKEPNARRPRYVWRYDVPKGEVVELFEPDDAAPQGAGKRVVDRAKVDAWLQFPLSVGKKYTVKRAWDNGRGFDEYTAEVQAYEKVKVEGGEFDSYRIRFAGFWNQREGGSYAGRSEHLVWYAPAAKTTVRWQYTNRTSNGGSWNDTLTELVKWEPGAAN